MFGIEALQMISWSLSISNQLRRMAARNFKYDSMERRRLNKCKDFRTKINEIEKEIYPLQNPLMFSITLAEIYKEKIRKIIWRYNLPTLSAPQAPLSECVSIINILN
jgi:hypothetical protein